MTKHPSPLPPASLIADHHLQRQDDAIALLMALIIALACTLAIYLLLAIVCGVSPIDACLGIVPDTHLPWIAAVLLSRSILQPLNVMVFFLAVIFLLFRMYRLPIEFRAFSQPFFLGLPIGEDHLHIIHPQVDQQLQENILAIGKEYAGTPPLLVRRMLLGAQRLGEGASSDDVHRMMQAQSEIDATNTSNRYTLVRYIIWLIPTIGFLGTVVGIGIAIMQFATIVTRYGSGADFTTQLQENLGAVAGNLGIAFDTTLLALFLSALLVAMTSVIQSRDEDLLSRIDEFCLKFFIGRMTNRSQAGDTSMILQAVTVLMEQIQSLLERLEAQNTTIDDFVRNLHGHLERQTTLFERLTDQSSPIHTKP